MKVAIIDGIAAHYRLLLFQKLSRLQETDYHLYASNKKHLGIEVIDPSLASLPVSEGGIKWSFIDNVVFRNRIIWQNKILKLATKGEFDIFLFIGESQVVSSWIGVLICKIRKKSVVFWGHGLYGNEKYFKGIIRHVFNKLPDAYLVYNVRSKELLVKAGIKEEKLFVVNNSLNHDAHMNIRNSLTNDEIWILKKKLFPQNSDLPVLLFIGRLTQVKKIDQLIESVNILHQRGKKLNCLIIGSGDLDNYLKELVSSLKLDNFFHFYGACYDERENALLLSLSDCCVSPGNVGLTAIHSMSFGTPVVSHDDLTCQMPEVSSVIENVTGELFKKDDISDLADKIEKLIYVNGKYHYSKNCMKMIDDLYNPDYQVRIFGQMVDFLKRNNTINHGPGN
jgi:glycosyltransferase involved in cell wall biosynthesis